MTRLCAVAVLVAMAGGALVAQERRSPGLVALYGAYATTQALDAHSTHLVLSKGGSEANPIMQPCVESVACTVAVKAGVSVLVIWIVDRFVRPEHPTAAKWLMGGLVGMSGGVVAWNYTVAARAKK